MRKRKQELRKWGQSFFHPNSKAQDSFQQDMNTLPSENTAIQRPNEHNTRFAPGKLRFYISTFSRAQSLHCVNKYFKSSTAFIIVFLSQWRMQKKSHLTHGFQAFRHRTLLLSHLKRTMQTGNPGNQAVYIAGLMSRASLTQSRSRGQKEQITSPHTPCQKPTHTQKWHRCCDYVTLNPSPPPRGLRIGESHPLLCPAHMQQQRLGRSNTGAHDCYDFSWCLTGE